MSTNKIKRSDNTNNFQNQVNQTSKKWYVVAALVALVALGGAAFGGTGIMQASGFALPSFVPQVMISAFKTVGYGSIGIVAGSSALGVLAGRVAYITHQERKHEITARQEEEITTNKPENNFTRRPLNDHKAQEGNTIEHVTKKMQRLQNARNVKWIKKNHRVSGTL